MNGILQSTPSWKTDSNLTLCGMTLEKKEWLGYCAAALSLIALIGLCMIPVVRQGFTAQMQIGSEISFVAIPMAAGALATGFFLKLYFRHTEDDITREDSPVTELMICAKDCLSMTPAQKRIAIAIGLCVVALFLTGIITHYSQTSNALQTSAALWKPMAAVGGGIIASGPCLFLFRSYQEHKKQEILNSNQIPSCVL